MLAIMHGGFFIYECKTQTWFDLRFKTFNRALNFHHLISFIATFYVVVFQIHHFYGTTLPLLEMSTPFSCICYIFLKMDKTDSFIWKANQLVLVHVFHLRSVFEVINFYELFRYWDMFKILPLGLLIVHTIGVVSTLFFLTPLWTYRKTKQLFDKKDLGSSSSSDGQKKNE